MSYLMIDQKQWSSKVRLVDCFEVAEDLDDFVVQTRAPYWAPLKPLLKHEFLLKLV